MIREIFGLKPKLKFPEKEKCLFCGRFSLIKLDNKEAVFACGTKIKFKDYQDGELDVLKKSIPSKYCFDATIRTIKEIDYDSQRIIEDNPKWFNEALP